MPQGSSHETKTIYFCQQHEKVFDNPDDLCCPLAGGKGNWVKIIGEVHTKK